MGIKYQLVYCCHGGGTHRYRRTLDVVSHISGAVGLEARSRLGWYDFCHMSHVDCD